MKIGAVKMRRLQSLWLLIVAAAASNIQEVTSNPAIVEHPEDTYVARNDPVTLNCKAEGEPAPTITWYRDGQLVIANDNPTSHRMLLPNGQLFFLRVIRRGTGESDIGSYYCNATNPETKVSVISRSAFLKIATIKDEFREQPQNVEVAVGAEFVLNCKPPRGEPEPRIRWKKDEVVIREGDERHILESSGNLRVVEVQKEDSGIYVCIASNMGGEKESIPAQVFVKEKPVILDGPKDTTVQEGAHALLQCQGTGDPEPVVVWKKLEGQVPAERSLILDDRSLKIQKTQVSDEGVYVCRIENSLGWQEAQAMLTVHSRPSFLETPRDKVVGVGKRVSIRCVVTGNPLPAVFWNRAASQIFMFPSQDHGRFRVTEDGTLIVENVQREDAGEYTCQGLSIAGSAYAKARIDVKDSDLRPPPIIYQGPQNQTLPISGAATLPCLARGDPTPTIHWLKNNVIISKDPRMIIHESGTLDISDLRLTDTGLYTCQVISEAGETSWTAALLIESTDNPSIIFHRTPEPSAFPGAPTKPTCSDVTETSVKLTWKVNVSQQGASPILMYMIEYFSHDIGLGWVVASDSVTEQTFVVHNLQPDTSYIFIVRARNSHGLSLPSPVSTAIRTLRGDTPARSPRPTPGHYDLAVVAEKLSGQVLYALQTEVLSSTAIKLKWEVRKNIQYIEGFHIRYRVLDDPDDGSRPSYQGYSGSNVEFVIKTIQSPGVTTYLLNGLQKFMWYEIRVQPYYSTVEGVATSVRARTFEDVPSLPPRNIRSSLLDNSTLLITWEAPPKHSRNGQLKGYKIYLFGNETKFDQIIQADFSLESFPVTNLVKGMTYKVQMSAFNRMGEGLLSEAILTGQTPVEVGPSFFREPWFIVMMIATIGVALWIALCILSVFIFRRHRMHRRAQKNNSIIAASHCPEDPRLGQKSSSQANSQFPLLAGHNKDAMSSCQVNVLHDSQTCMMAPCCYDNESPSDGDSKGNINCKFAGHTYQTLESIQNPGNPRGHSPAGYNPLNCALPYNMYGSDCGALPAVMMRQFVNPSMAVPYATATLFGSRMPPGSDSIPNPQAYMIQPNARRGNSITDSRNDSSNSSESAGMQITNESKQLSQPLLFNYPPSDRLSHTDNGSRGHVFNNFNSKCSSQPGLKPIGYNQRQCSRSSDGRSDYSDSNMDRSEQHDFQNGYSDDCNEVLDDSYVGVEPQRSLTPESFVTDTDNQAECGTNPWPNSVDSISNCSSLSSVEESNDEVDTFADNADFADAVTRAAKQSGMTVIGSTVSSQTDPADLQKTKKPGRQRQRARGSSPCSTDSNYSSSQAANRQYPRSKRRRPPSDQDGRLQTIADRDNGSQDTNSKHTSLQKSGFAHPLKPAGNSSVPRVTCQSDCATSARPNPLHALNSGHNMSAPIV